MSTATSTLPTATTTETGRRIRGDARMERLTPDQQAHVRYWLMEERHTYRYVAELIREKFGVNVGRSAVAVYYHRHFLPERHEDEIAAAAALSRLPVGEFDAVTINHAKALAFSALTEPAPRLDTADRLLTLVHRVHKQQIADRRLALDERRVDLRAQELAARPPRQSRSSNSELRSPSLSPSRPPLPSATSSPPIRDTTVPAPEHLTLADTPEPSASAPQGPTPPTPASVTSTPPPCPPCPNSSAPASPPPLPTPPTPDSSFPSLSSLQSSPLPPPPPSQKSPPNPPLFPASSGINPPSPPSPTASSIVNRNSQIVNSPHPTAPTVPHIPLPLPANLTREQKFHLCSKPDDAPPFPPRPTLPTPTATLTPPKPKPRIPYREVTRAEWG